MSNTSWIDTLFVTGQYPQREKYTWKLFNEGIYTLADGTVLTNSGSGSGGGKAAILQSAKKFIHTWNNIVIIIH